MASRYSERVESFPRFHVFILTSIDSAGIGYVNGRADARLPLRGVRVDDPHDQRTRPSVLLAYGGRNVVIDTTPDFRFQAMRARIDHLDAVIYTHGHADHIMGLDDIRPYNMKQRGAVPIYGAAETLAILRRQFAYIFDEAQPGSLLPLIELHAIDGPFDLSARMSSQSQRCTGRSQCSDFGSATWPI